MFESWGNPTEVLEFRWKENDTIVNSEISLNQHDYEVSFEDLDNVAQYDTGKWNKM